MRENIKDRFKRLGTKRTKEVLKKLKVLGNCANRYAYDYNEKDIRKIFDAIDSKIKEIKAKFDSELASKEKNNVDFRL